MLPSQFFCIFSCISNTVLGLGKASTSHGRGPGFNTQHPQTN
jgi:hypothetical protein